MDEVSAKELEWINPHSLQLQASVAFARMSIGIAALYQIAQGGLVPGPGCFNSVLINGSGPLCERRVNRD